MSGNKYCLVYCQNEELYLEFPPTATEEQMEKEATEYCQAMLDDVESGWLMDVEIPPKSMKGKVIKSCLFEKTPKKEV